MAQIDQHAPGAFCWMELSTSDQTAAKSFYTSVLGWSFEDSPMGPGDYYTMFQMGERNVGAAYTARGDEVAMGVPPHWNLYMNVKNADDAAKRAAELGGTVLAGPFDVMSHGRMAVLSDPQGAVFSIWQPRDHNGFGLRDQHATFCWADLNAPDQQASTEFYGGLFGWTFTPGEGGYLHIKNGEAHIGGIPPTHQQAPNAPPNWMIYIQADDCDAVVAKAKDGGARVMMGPETMENVGRFAILADPQSAVFALYSPMPKK